MSFNFQSQGGWFYLFTGIHSALIGLFLFYTPVWLWQQGFLLKEIFWFAALVGFAFIGALALWDQARCKYSPVTVSMVTLLLGLATFVTTFAVEASWFLWVLALLLGAYNAWMWTTQRALFLDLVDPGTSGKAYGNLQVFVFLVLQVSIFVGAYLNEQADYFALFLGLLVISVLGGVGLCCFGQNLDWPATLKEKTPVSFATMSSFSDGAKSPWIFLLDGPFLYLESWFWLLSLFWLANSSFWTLGWLVIALALSFTVLFWILKQFVDAWELKGLNIYDWAVVLYALSWGLRGFIDEIESKTVLGFMLVAIMFFTTYFRLLFNKRFYDLAHQTLGHHYLILKSYYSQLGLALVFAGLGLFWVGALDFLYLGAGLLSLFYLRYRVKA